MHGQKNIKLKNSGHKGSFSPSPMFSNEEELTLVW